MSKAFRLIAVFAIVLFLVACGQQKQDDQVKAKQNTAPSQPAATQPISTPPQSQVQTKEATVYVTNTGKKYHRAGCRYLSKSQIPISLSDAKADGYGPCSKCNPPY